MSPDPTPEVFIPDQEYSHVWAQATAQTLEKLQGAPLIPAPEGPAPAAKEGAQAGESLTVLFKVSGALHGEHSFQFLRSDGVRLAQLLMGETLDPSVAFTEGHADALNEIFRQFAGLAATACKSKYGAEVQFELLPGKSGEWTPVNNSIWTFSSEKIPALQWTMLFNPELHGSLEAAHQAASVPEPAPTAEAPPSETAAAPSPSEAAAPAASTPSAEPASAAAEAGPAAPPPAPPAAPTPPEESAQPAPAASETKPSTPASPLSAEPSPAAAPPAPPPKPFVPPPPPPRPPTAAPAPPPVPAPPPTPNPANLDLLLDVALEATLRFGQREMILREILELRPGSVIELNRRVQEPAELLVAGRVIARGEVVIVDGAYGLRITDITQPHQRLESVEA